MVQTVQKEQTPLERDMEAMAKQIGVAVIALCAIIFSAGILHGIETFQMFITAVSLAVAAIPEGLAAVVVITLAVGVQRMSSRNAIVKKMKAVETLGCATVICTDKTGTLTKNEMTVRKVVLPGQVVDVGGSGYVPNGHFESSGKRIEPDAQLKMLMRAAILCNDAYLREGKSGWGIIGDPTEGALVVLAAKGGFYKEQEEKLSPPLMEFPFDSKRKMMSTIRKEGKRCVSYVKGAPEVVLKRCTSIMVGERVRKASRADLSRMERETNALTSKGYRTLALAYRDIDGKARKEDVEKALGPGGAMETFVKAREQGKVRFLGFSAHSVEAALSAMDRFRFDTILFPFNWVCFFRGDFGPQVTKAAKAKGMGMLALKAMAR
ncbi:MAG: HAD-IC family P-type ATPase, partial [candidate division WOR-3 bacterium]